MSLAMELTNCQARLAESGRKASAEARKLKGLVAPSVFDELMLQLCIFAAESNALKAMLGSLLMMGELEQMPPAVTADSLELAECMRRDLVDGMDVSEGTRRAFAHQLEMIGDDTLTREVRP